MKKTCTILCLLLALVMLLCTACTPKAPANDGNDTDTSDMTNNESTPTITSPKQIWYSLTNFSAVDLRNMPNITLYELKPGYYQYTEQISGTCTYEDNVITFTPEGGEELCWVFDTKKGALTTSSDGQTTVYTTNKELPTEFVALSFPKFHEMDCTALVTLPNYREFKFELNAELLAAVDIFNAYHEAVTDATKKEITGRVAQMGDYVSVDYKGFLNGEAFEGGDTKGNPATLLIDANSGYIPGFAEGIIGKEVDSTFDVNVKFPDNYHEKTLAGKDVVFTMTLHAIYDLTLTDEEVKKIDESNTDATYADLLAENVETYRLSDIQNQLKEKTPLNELPESTYLYFYQDYESLYRLYAAYYGMEYEALLAYFGLSDALLREEAKSIAKEYIVVYAVAQTEGLEMTNTEFEEKRDAHFAEMIANGEMTEEEKQEILQNGGDMALHVDFTMERVYHWIYEQMTAQ